MRLATFNLESFGEGAFDLRALTPRIAALRPRLSELAADILCLQEVNAQKDHPHEERELSALEALLHSTPYAGFSRAVTPRPESSSLAERHNIVVLSRFPILSTKVCLAEHVALPLWQPSTASPPATSPSPVAFDRPFLHVELDIGQPRPLHVFAVHLRAPLAAPIPGGKTSAQVWNSTPSWAEGYFLAAMKRVGQALDLRLAVDEIFEKDEKALIAVTGDFNAAAPQSALRIVEADPDDTGNRALAYRRLHQMESVVPAARRHTVLHRGKGHTLDHILVSRELLLCADGIHIFNEDLRDEVRDRDTERGSFHAALLASFDLARLRGPRETA